MGKLWDAIRTYTALAVKKEGEYTERDRLNIRSACVPIITICKNLLKD